MLGVCCLDTRCLDMLSVMLERISASFSARINAAGDRDGSRVWWFVFRWEAARIAWGHYVEAEN